MTVVESIVAAEPNRPQEGSVRAWLASSGVLTWRQLLVYVRDVVTVLPSLIVHAVSMVLMKVVLGDAVGNATGQNSLYVAQSSGEFTPDQLEVLLPGDSLGPWRFQAVEGNSAVFQAGDQTRRVAIP